MERTSFTRDRAQLEEERITNCDFSSTWLQRNYTCSFCKRQFNSAQALGGHMNVHRRDRAILRQLPSLIFPYPNPKNSTYYSNSNLVHPLSAASKTPFPLPPPMHLAPYSDNHISFVSPPLSSFSSQPSCHLKRSTQSDEESNKAFAQKYDRVEVSKEGFSEVISLDLEMSCKDPAEVLDLELRLGCF